MNSSFKTSSKPTLACEIAAVRVLAGRISENGADLETCSSFELAPGSVVPDLTENNLRQSETVFQTIRDTLGSVSGRARDVIAVLPDAAVRVALLDFDALPTTQEEAE